MRGFKLTTAIITIIESVFGIISGFILIVAGAVSSAFIDEILAEAGLDATGIVAAVMGALVVIGIIVLGISILFLIFGIKFCSHKPNKGIAITLLVFNIIGLLGFFVYWLSGIVSLLLTVFIIVYLSLLGKQNQDGNYNNNDYSNNNY